MKRPLAIFFSLLIVSSLGACNLPKGGTPAATNPDIVATNVVLTLAAFTQTVPQQTPIPSLSPTTKQPTNTEPVILSTPIMTFTVTITPTSTMTLKPTNTPIPKPGSIDGSISGYPYGALPSLSIVAFGQEPPYNYSYLITSPGDTSYSMSSNYLIPGKFRVVAYDSSNHKGGCPALITVISEQTVTCNISDWSGSYPAKPAGVPSP